MYAYLFYLCSAGGLLMIFGAIWLLSKEKLFLDAQTKEVLFVELPFLGKVRTNAPTVFLIVLGVTAIFYPVYVSKETVANTRYYQIEQKVISDAHPVTVYLVVHEQNLEQDGPIIFPMPALNDQSYAPELIYVTGMGTSGHRPIPLNEEHQGVIKLTDEAIQVPKGSQVRQTPLLQQFIKPKPANFQ
jgi:hypothetical protein